MKKTMKKSLLMLFTITTMAVIFCFGASAAKEGYYTYSVYDNKATITDVDESISGTVTVPSTLGGYSVTTIDKKAFYCCESLTSVTIPKSVTTIGNSAFHWCTNLQSITIPNSVTTIGSYAFLGCESLNSATIPNSVTTIGDSAFSNCYSLKSITIPNSVTTIGEGAFHDTAWYNNQPDGVVYAGKVAYGYKGTMPQNTSIIIKAGTKGISDGAFEYCHRLTSVTIPNSVTTIGDYTFSCCGNLMSVTIPDGVTAIGIRVFEYCESLTSVTIPNSVTSIGNGAFEYCESLTSVTIPNSVTSIGSSAFRSCKSLTNVKVSDNVVYVGDHAFYDTPWYNNQPDGVIYIGKTLYDYKGKMPSNTKLSVKEGTKSICDGVFSGCTGLISVTIPDTVTLIGDSAFSGCTSLASITIPDSVTSIGCSILSDTAYYNNKNNWKNKVLYVGKHLLEAKESLSGAYNTKPGTLTIAGCAFGGCENLTQISIPDGLKFIGEDAFLNCYKLNEVYIPKSVTEIGGHAIGYSLWDGPLSYASSADIVIEGVKGSAAEKYAKDNGLTFVEYKPHTHTYTTSTTKATLTKNGSVVKKCTVCGTVSSTSTIYYPKTIALSATSGEYNGKAKTPTVTVKDSKGNTLKKDTDYTVKYESGRKNPGKYDVTVTFKGKYSGTKALSFTITPMTLSKVTATQTTTSVTLKWSKVTGATGYRVFQNVNGKWKTLTNTTKLTYTINKLKAGTAYTFAVRPYTVDGKDTILAAKFTQLKTATMCKTPTLKLTSTKKGVANASWTNVAGETGYELYGSSKKSSGFKKLATTKMNVVKASKKKLTSKKTYYFKVRAYTKTDSGTVYSDWSAVKSIKIK